LSVYCPDKRTRVSSLPIVTTPPFPVSPDAPDSVQRSPRLGEQLALKIAKAIELGEYPDGARLPTENDLAARFGVSRPVIREALSRLRDQGLVASRRGSGSYVRLAEAAAAPGGGAFAPIKSLSEVRRCFEFRATIEGDAAWHAALNRTPKSLEAMEEALKKLEVAIVSGQVGMSPDLEFHLAVARATDNPYFETVIRLLAQPIEFTINLARSLSMSRPIEHKMTIQAEHIGIYRAIEAGDADKARSIMRAHLGNACSRIFDGTPMVSAET
jgi:GntR family transcriptional regulator, transcriptional repressor for pyruvate dehydrogenase complex